MQQAADGCGLPQRPAPRYWRARTVKSSNDMTPWRDDRNTQSRARLLKAVPGVFPPAVLIHALARPLVPPQPRLAVESYWRHHPVRADRLARALAKRSAVPEGWRWRLATASDDGRARSFRLPPAPFREAAHRAGPGTCCLCGQPVYRFGWHRDLWREGKPVLLRRVSIDGLPGYGNATVGRHGFIALSRPVPGYVDTTVGRRRRAAEPVPRRRCRAPSVGRAGSEYGRRRHGGAGWHPGPATRSRRGR